MAAHQSHTIQVQAAHQKARLAISVMVVRRYVATDAAAMAMAIIRTMARTTVQQMGTMALSEQHQKLGTRTESVTVKKFFHTIEDRLCPNEIL
uniref:Uncharacterized protein n=1 Tax=Parascaris univalens TaxID=6257 RepID=A0A915C127_PARUN